MLKARIAVLLLLFLYQPVLSTNQTTTTPAVVDGQWSSWQVVSGSGCCQNGADYQKVRRHCTNPAPENGGQLCLDAEANIYVAQSEGWRHCACDCNPPCDGVTSFCANDIGLPAECKCFHGKVRNGTTVNQIVTCHDPPDPLPDPAVNATCNIMSESWNTPIELCRSVTSGWVIAWCLATLIVCAVFCRFTPERTIHMAEEVTLIVVFGLIAVPFENMDMAGDAKGTCAAVSVMNQFFFLCTMTYFFLEALHAYSIATYVVPKDGFFHTLVNLLIGVLLPVLIVGIDLAIAHQYYGRSGCQFMLDRGRQPLASESTLAVQKDKVLRGRFMLFYELSAALEVLPLLPVESATTELSCFCDMTSPQVWTFIVPLILLFFAVGIAGEAAAQEKYRPLKDTDMGQYLHATISRKGVLLITPCALVAYVCALLAVHLASPVMWICYVIFGLILGPLVFFYHTMCDYVVGTAMYAKMKCLPCYKKWKEPEGGAQSTEGEFSDFYKWVTDGRPDNTGDSEKVLFEKHIH